MILLNVLHESWVVKLCRVMAAGRQIAVRQIIFILLLSHFIAGYDSQTFTV